MSFEPDWGCIEEDDSFSPDIEPEWEENEDGWECCSCSRGPCYQ